MTAFIVSLFAFGTFGDAYSNSADASSTQTQSSLFTHAPGSPISLASGPGNVVVGDMNNDGNLDLVMSSERERGIVILPGKGDGQFAAPLSRTITPDSPGDMALGDLNSDANLDLAITSHDSYGVMLLRGDGKGSLAIAPNSPMVMKVGQHPHTHGLAVADMNGDNRLDLISCNNADNDISIALGDGRGNFTRATQSPFPVGPSPYPFAVGDVNNDERLDIVATASATGPQRRQQLSLSRALTLLLSDGKGGFRPSQLAIRTGEPWFAAIGDFNNDRKPDIVATHHELNAMTVMIGDGRGGFVEARQSPFEFQHAFFQVALADANRDGNVDIFAAGGDRIGVILGDGRGGFTAVMEPVARGAYRVAIADVNKDRRIDVVTTSAQSNSVSVLLGR